MLFMKREKTVSIVVPYFVVDQEELFVIAKSNLSKRNLPKGTAFSSAKSILRPPAKISDNKEWTGHSRAYNVGRHGSRERIYRCLTRAPYTAMITAVTG